MSENKIKRAAETCKVSEIGGRAEKHGEGEGSLKPDFFKEETCYGQRELTSLTKIGREYNTSVLAYIGDAVYELYIRKWLIESPIRNHADILHKYAVKYVSAGAQAKIIKTILNTLKPEERSLVKRGRNHKTATKAKNAHILTYKWATGFEVLIGALYLADDTERLDEIIGRSRKVIEGDKPLSPQS